MSLSELIKLSVNMPVDGETLRAAVALNGTLVRDWQCDTSFGEAGNSSPHITIAMGQVAASSSTLEDLLRTVSRDMHEIEDWRLRRAEFSAPYRESLTGRYIFCDVTFSDELTQWRLAMADHLRGFFVEPARTTQDAHMTVGHIPVADDGVDDFLRTQGPLPSSTLQAIDLSVAGDKGRKSTVLTTLRWQ